MIPLLLKTKDGYVFAETDFTPSNTYENLKTGETEIHIVYTIKVKILEAIYNPDTARTNSNINLITKLLLQDKITWEQAMLALDNQSIVPILVYMMLKPA